VVTDGGYRTGELAPGHRSPFAAARAAHHLLSAHAEAMGAMRPLVPAGRLGLVVNLEPKHAASESEEDRAATRRADAYMNRHFLDPALLGAYPRELAEVYGEAWEARFDAEAAGLRTAIDWLGINYYKRGVVRAAAAEWAGAAPVPQPDAVHTELDWEVYPPGLHETLGWVRERYGPLPLYVTENGAAFYDPPSPVEGVVEDPLRVAYLRDHLREVRRAIADGVDVRGYFAWSLLDNFEWSHGTSKRFGLVHVDYATQRRTPKRSAEWYAAVIGSGGASLG
jgi:beta-glucosidase